MRPLRIAIDFDGTIVENAFPRIGEPLPGAFEVMRELQEAGHRLILNTCREDHKTRIDKRHLTDAVEFCRENGIEFVSVNENHPDDEFRDPDECKAVRKVYADIYIDDRNLGGFPGWDVVREMILGEPVDQ